jgi:hypothetical protein
MGVGAAHKSFKEMKRIKHIDWHGAEWVIEQVPEADLEEEGRTRPGRHTISVAYINDDQFIMTLLHESLHVAFPWMEDKGLDEERINAAEVPLKTFLEAHGVDLTPLLEGYKKC